MKKLHFGLALALTSAAASAVTVNSVTARDPSGKESFGEVLVRCEAKAGSEYDPAVCQRDIKTLRDVKEFDDISVEVTETSNGEVDITYVVTRKKRFQGPLAVTGNEYWGAGKIARLSGLLDGYPYGEAEIASAAGLIRDEYRRKHFTEVKVTPVVEPLGEDSIKIRMEIVEGSRHKNAPFTFQGNLAFKDSELRPLVKEYPWWNPVGWFVDACATDQDFSEACDAVTTHYRNAGYLDATVAVSGVEYRDDDGLAERVFTVDEGTRYTVGDIKVQGVTKYPNEAVVKAVTAIQSGAIAADNKLQEAAHEIEIYCGSGPEALAETHVECKRIPREDAPEVLDLTFDVTEGVPVTIRNVVVTGNDYTKDKVIRREIDLSPGDPMLEDRADRSKRRLENLRYFERVRYYLVNPREPAVDGREIRDLVYELSEKNTGNFMVGVGASSVDSVYGTVELSESNFDIFNPWRFRGAGQKGRILVQAGPRIQTYEASVTEPYFLDRVLEFTVEGYRRQRWFDEYDAIRSGAAATLAYPVKFWPTAKTTGRLGFKVAAEFVEMKDVDDDEYYKGDDSDQWFKREERKYSEAWEVPFRVFWEDDTRDRYIFATKGHKTSIYGDIVAGDNEYWRLGFNYRQYMTVSKKHGHVFSFGVRGETVDAFSGDVPIYDRLFLGGPRSIRGVEYREVGPRLYKDSDKHGGHAAWGGQTSWCVNGEYTIPVVKYVRLAGFSDLGSVAPDVFDLDGKFFTWTVGLGIRLDIESFPIRLDFGVPVVAPSHTKEQVFSFSIGYDF